MTFTGLYFPVFIFFVRRSYWSACTCMLCMHYDNDDDNDDDADDDYDARNNVQKSGLCIREATFRSDDNSNSLDFEYVAQIRCECVTDWLVLAHRRDRRIHDIRHRSIYLLT